MLTQILKANLFKKPAIKPCLVANDSVQNFTLSFQHIYLLLSTQLYEYVGNRVLYFLNTHIAACTFRVKIVNKKSVFSPTESIYVSHTNFTISNCYFPMQLSFICLSNRRKLYSR